MDEGVVAKDLGAIREVCLVMEDWPVRGYPGGSDLFEDDYSGEGEDTPSLWGVGSPFSCIDILSAAFA